MEPFGKIESPNSGMSMNQWIGSYSGDTTLRFAPLAVQTDRRFAVSWRKPRPFGRHADFPFN